MSNSAASLKNETEIFKQIHKTFTSCATVTCGVCQGCTNPWRQVARATNIRGFSVELASCHLPGAQNFEVGSRRLESLCRLPLVYVATYSVFKNVVTVSGSRFGRMMGVRNDVEGSGVL